MPGKSTDSSSLRISERTAAVLEWPEFLRYFSRFVSSPVAREELHRIQPVTDPSAEFEISREALTVAKADQIPTFSTLDTVETILRKTQIENQICDGSELYKIYRLAALNNEIRNSAGGWKVDYKKLHTLCRRLPDLRTLEADISRQIDPGGDVKDDATPELARIIRRIEQLKSRVEHALERYFRDSRYKNALQEEYVTYRHGRAVLVVRIEEQKEIRGVVHGESGSGASLFIEPLSVMELNNEIAQLVDRKLQETTRILKQLTRSAGENADVLRFAHQHLISLDLIFARGRFGKALDCAIPEMASDFEMDIRNARHPLLQTTLKEQGKEIVPLHLKFPEDKKALVVTGPNTGGKTVFLKTIGLLALIAHCGIPVPAAEGSRIPMLSSIEADIGDQQSIAESLSTFSSHISSIVSILGHVSSRSLVLLDELGTGTDPEEGAALAVAILQEFLRRPVMTLITSHHSPIKMFAFNHPQCMTAAMEFDRTQLQPTYRVQMEQIGASHALDMAKRLGMPDSILTSARQLAGETEVQVQEFQTQLQKRINELEEISAALHNEKSEWEVRANQESARLEKMKEKLESEIRRLREGNVDLVRTLNARVQNLISTIRDAQTRQQLRKQYEQDVAPTIQKLEHQTDFETPASEPTTSTDLTPGDRVWVQLYKDFGEIISLKKNEAEVLIRNKRFVVPISGIEKKGKVQDSLPRGIQVHLAEKEVDAELNLIGKTVEEANEIVDKYLDDAFVAQLPEVRLIHGHGTGRLKKAVEAMLQGHPHVRSFRSAPQERGGSAVTIVVLR